MQKDINTSIFPLKFPNALIKEADISSVYKKKMKQSKEDYRPISILQISQKCM